ncbi:protein split ends-like [Oscarella lobularis]|uniref:protein split ends-like n=1 Tax=Oscarella lobularis TaxID=121494 RepID=UPI0033135F15
MAETHDKATQTPNETSPDDRESSRPVHPSTSNDIVTTNSGTSDLGRMSIKNSDENVGIRWFGSTSATVIAQERAFRPGHIPRGPTSAFHVTTSRGAMTTKSQLKSISSVIRPQAAVADKPISSGSGRADMITVSSTSHVLSSSKSLLQQSPPPPPSLLIASSEASLPSVSQSNPPLPLPPGGGETKTENKSADAASGLGSKIAAAAPAGIILNTPAALVGGTTTTATAPRMTPISNVATSIPGSQSLSLPPPPTPPLTTLSSQPSQSAQSPIGSRSIGAGSVGGSSSQSRTSTSASPRPRILSKRKHGIAESTLRFLELVSSLRPDVEVERAVASLKESIRCGETPSVNAIDRAAASFSDTLDDLQKTLRQAKGCIERVERQNRDLEDLRNKYSKVIIENGQPKKEASKVPRLLKQHEQQKKEIENLRAAYKESTEKRKKQTGEISRLLELRVELPKNVKKDLQELKERDVKRQEEIQELKERDVKRQEEIQELEERLHSLEIDRDFVNTSQFIQDHRAKFKREKNWSSSCDAIAEAIVNRRNEVSHQHMSTISADAVGMLPGIILQMKKEASASRQKLAESLTADMVKDASN